MTIFEKKTGAIVIGVVRNNEMIPAPDPKNFKFQEGDIVIVVGTREQINKFVETFGKKE
jgi:TrkA domain protein